MVTLIPDFFTNMTPLERVYFLSAALGGMLFLTRMFLLLVGVGHHGDFGGHDAGGAHGAAHAGAGDSHDGQSPHDTDSVFKMISVQGLIGFFTMFGLVGLALVRGSGVSEPVSLFGAVVGGSAMMVAIGMLTSFIMGLQSDGNIDPRGAIGKQGTVYLTIGKGGTGKAQLVVNNQLKIYEAIGAEGSEAFPTDTRVEVVDVVNGSLLVVKAVSHKRAEGAAT